MPVPFLSGCYFLVIVIQYLIHKEHFSYQNWDAQGTIFLVAHGLVEN